MTNTAVRVANPYLDTFRAAEGHTYMRWSAPGRLDMARGFPARRDLVKRYAWAVPDADALACVARHAAGRGLVEMGAGSGYWTMLLRGLGVDVVAYDHAPPGRTRRRNGFHDTKDEGSGTWTPGETWTEVTVGNTKVLERHRDRVLFLCWPPYDTDMAYAALRRWDGDVLIYVGEDSDGCNATQKFFDLRDEKYDQVEEVEIPQWWGLHDRLSVHRRRR